METLTDVLFGLLKIIEILLLVIGAGILVAVIAFAGAILTILAVLWGLVVWNFIDYGYNKEHWWKFWKYFPKKSGK